MTNKVSGFHVLPFLAVDDLDSRVVGHWKSAGGTPILSLSLEGSITNLDDKSKETFLELIRSMLKWEPETRKGATHLLQNPWIKSLRKA